MRKPIPGFDRYEIDDTGRVFNVETGKELQGRIQPNGYKMFELFYETGKSKQLLAHRLVAQSFIPNEKGLPIINHKDENPLNNCASNLEWCTYKYNSNYGHCKEKREIALQAFRKSDKLKDIARTNGKSVSKPVRQFLSDGCIVDYESGKAASIATGVNHSHILEVCLGKRKSAGGYLWAYREE